MAKVNNMPIAVVSTITLASSRRGVAVRGLSTGAGLALALALGLRLGLLGLGLRLGLPGLGLVWALRLVPRPTDSAGMTVASAKGEAWV